MIQRTVNAVNVGDPIGPADFALPLYRLVAAAGGNRDFNSIHHNRSYAKATNAPDAYASTFFLLGTWERVVRDWIGDAGTIRSISGFRMRKFNLVGSIVTIQGTVTSIQPDGIVTLELVSKVGDEVTVGPGQVEVTLPLETEPLEAP
ncbi:MAG: acyl dehydratase [Streptosporangiaceae bacterium]|nr:acyl dehydratase [Streptosporangiaceae bacterium]